MTYNEVKQFETDMQLGFAKARYVLIHLIVISYYIIINY